MLEFTRLGTPSRACSGLVALDGESYGVAAAEAEGGDAAFEVAALEFEKQGHENTRARCADGMADGHRAALARRRWWPAPRCAPSAACPAPARAARW
jgi:hypothetical protein